MGHPSNLASASTEQIISSCDHGNDCKGTWNLLFSCISTIILCMWLAVHPNVLYSDFNSHSENRTVTSMRKKLSLGVQKIMDSFTYRFPIFILAVIYPEYILSWTVQQRATARHVAKQEGWTTTHGHFLIMGGYHLFNQHGKPLRPLKMADIRYATQRGSFEIPTREEIQDRNKANTLLTVIALVQVVWYLMSCIVRATQSDQSLPLTKLDAVTISYIAASFSIYVAWWDKPRNVLDPVRVYQNKGTRFFRLSESIPTQRGFISVIKNTSVDDLIDVAFGVPDTVFGLEDAERVPRLYAGECYYVYNSVLVAALMGLISTAIHCIAWSFGSPLLPVAEIVLWRAFSLAAWLPLIFVGMVALAVRTSNADLPRRLTQSMNVILIVFMVLYVISRIALLILALMALRVLTSTDSRTVHWVNLIPHL